MSLRLINSADPRLWTPTRKVHNPAREVMPCLPEMRQILRDTRGLALAAPQVGVPFRFFIYPRADQLLWLFINPSWQTIEGYPAKESLVEGCLSHESAAVLVPRFYKIAAFWETKDGRKMYEPMEGISARVFQHECDHLDGVCIYTKP